MASFKNLKFKKVYLFFIISLIFLILFFLFSLSLRQNIEKVYGTTFSDKYAKELNLDPKTVLNATFQDLGFKKIRLVAYWDDIEKEKNIYDFSSLDWQIEMAEKYDAEVILAVGHRVPRWPECHLPEWFRELQFEEQKAEILKFISVVVSRYKDKDVIKKWQVENEFYLTSYAKQYCIMGLDTEFLNKEIETVRTISPNKEILLTDSGELKTWRRPYKYGDSFGSTMYLYVANRHIDDFRMPIPASFYNVKLWLWENIYGKKENILIELSIEPWLTKPIIKASLYEQLSKMNIERAQKTIAYAEKSNFKDQYLWGVEWWYYLKLKSYTDLWDFAKELKKE
jgi:hypothetical protein